ncbi:hypothetical protein FJT64_000846 [Amphibalanus amphitrite]|uniref:Uncharacterized protein n=1 Tax=Amphibalanus amphitrite TaxID=1232801 RepID=A0A6A4VVR9_AMPAM|nr:hypothetical protein FJT64_000846 [Amphibalanus amphitrite]
MWLKRRLCPGGWVMSSGSLAPSAPPAARPAAPAALAAATVDPLSPSMELSAALAFDEPGASATGDSDDEVVVLPPPPPRAPLDVILLDNSDISDDELVLDTNTECPERIPVLAPSTVGSGAGTRDPGRPSTSSAAEEPARPESDGATATDSEPRPKRRKQQLQERPIQSPVPPFVPTPPRVRVRVNAGEYTAAKHALEELLFGRLENATPIKRQTVLVLKTAQEEVRVQRSRHSQLKVRLWQVSQKQRNLLNRLNRGLAELPLEKRIEKIAEIEDLLSFVQVRVDGDEHEPVMLLEQKQSQQPSQFRVIAPDGVPAPPPGAEDTDADELSVM